MDSSSTPTRRPYFIEEDNGLASIANSDNLETPTFSGHHHQNHLISRPLYHVPPPPRRGSLRNLSNSYSSMSSPRSGRFYDGRFEEQQPHFLDSCFLCKKPIGGNRDIFMYRGDTPFCSEECREEQIERDESKEKKWNLKASMKAFRNKEQKEKSSSPNSNAQDYSFHSGAVAAA